MTRLQAWFENKRATQGALTGEQEQAAMAYARGETGEGPWEQWPEAQAQRSSGYDEVTATQWLINTLEDQGALSPRSGRGRYTVTSIKTGPRPGSSGHEALETTAQRAPAAQVGSTAAPETAPAARRRSPPAQCG